MKSGKYILTSNNQISSQSRAWVEVDLKAVEQNMRAVRDSLNARKDSCELMAVVKCDAYGHGLVPVSKKAVTAGAKWLGVATLHEASLLRDAGVSSAIYLLCVAAPQDAADIARLRVTPPLGDRVMLTALAEIVKEGGECAVHLDIDTGMGRSGVLPEQAVEMWKEAKSAGLEVRGVTTHFADAEHPNSNIQLRQKALFKFTLEHLQAAGASFDWIHTANSAATLTDLDSPCNLVRPGLLIYGISPLAHEDNCSNSLWNQLQPALSLKARIGQIRNLPAGHTISYGATYTLSRPTRVATVLIGYGDGFPRRLSNMGAVLIQGQHAPVLGRVCMDQTVVDITDIPGVEAGDTVVCIGRDGSSRITIEEIARQICTTPHEIPVALTSRLPRVYVNPD